MILFLSNHLRGPGASAGTRSWQQAKRLSHSDSVHVIIPGTDPVTEQPVTPQTYGGLPPDRVTVDLASSISLNRKNKINRMIFYLGTAFHQFRKGLGVRAPKAVLSMSLPVTTLLTAYTLSRIKKVPLVVDVRDLPFDMAEELSYIRFRTLLRLMKAVETFCLRRAAAILTVSPRYVPYLVKRGIPQEKIHVAIIGYDDFEPPAPETIAATRQEMEAVFPRPVKTIGVYTGTFGHVVEVDRVLEALDSLRARDDIGVVFVGSGQRLEDYRARAKAEGINAAFIGRRSKTDVAAICRAGDFCIYAAKDGALSAAMLGNKVFDYLGAERAIVYSGPDSAVSDVVATLDAGLITRSDDLEGLTRDILRLADEPETRAALEHGAARYRDKGYTAQDSAIVLEQVLTSIASTDKAS